MSNLFIEKRLDLPEFEALLITTKPVGRGIC